LRIIASATYAKLRGPRSAQRHRGTFAAIISHPVAAPPDGSPAAECRRNGCVPAHFAGREQLHKLLNVEGRRMLSRDQSQTVIIDLDLLTKRLQVTP
jgi:hypothetical protein